jgi:hypothetical protein
MLCELAHSFPPRVAELLQRDRNLSRNFREESVTDLLMASMVGLESFGIRVDFPDEPTTGGDMEWVFAAPLEVNGGRYLRVVLQAKRAQRVKLKSSDYWFYKHLDHGVPPGSQAQTLIGYAASSPGGIATLPLYIFYHPSSATAPATQSLPPVEGINLVFADLVAPVVRGGCVRNDKKVQKWRRYFLPLSDLLCWPVAVTDSLQGPAPGITPFIVDGAEVDRRILASGFHPDLVARRFNQRRERVMPPTIADSLELRQIQPAEGIPADIRRSIDGKLTLEDRRSLERPRVTLTTRLTRESPDFDATEALGLQSGN